MNYNELFLYTRQLFSCYKPKKKAAKDVIERLVMIIDAFKYRQILELFDDSDSFTKQADKACKDALRQVKWKDPKIKKPILNTDLSL